MDTLALWIYSSKAMADSLALCKPGDVVEGLVESLLVFK
jgi:hypothetical protein